MLGDEELSYDEWAALNDPKDVVMMLFENRFEELTIYCLAAVCKSTLMSLPLMWFDTEGRRLK